MAKTSYLSVLIFTIFFAFSKCQSSDSVCLRTIENTGDVLQWKLVWQDHFESDQIDAQKWTVANHHDDSQFCDCKYCLKLFKSCKFWITYTVAIMQERSKNQIGSF